MLEEHPRSYDSGLVTPEYKTLVGTIEQPMIHLIDQMRPNRTS